MFLIPALPTVFNLPCTHRAVRAVNSENRPGGKVEKPFEPRCLFVIKGTEWR